MGDVLRRHELQVWFVAEHVVDVPLIEDVEPEFGVWPCLGCDFGAGGPSRKARSAPFGA